MTTHRFTVNVPNPTAQSASVQLRLEPAKRQDFDWLPREFPKANLEVIDTGLALDPCAEERKPSLMRAARRVAIFLKAYSMLLLEQATKITQPLMPSAAPAVLVTQAPPSKGIAHMLSNDSTRILKACIFTALCFISKIFSAFQRLCRLLILALDPCAEKEKQNLELKLEPFTSVDIHVVINTATSKKPGVAGFHLVDRRNDKDVGGVFLVCSDPPFVEPVGQTVSTTNPCPATLARDLYAIQPGNDPSKPSNSKPMRSGDSLELVAQITNPTGKSLKDTQVYLEHLGASNVEFTPGTWNIGTLGTNDVFYATWPIRTTAWQTGFYETSIVVVSQGLEPVRLNGKLFSHTG